MVLCPEALVYSVKQDSAIKACLYGNKSFQDLLEHEKLKKSADEMADMMAGEQKQAKKATKAGRTWQMKL